MKKIILASLLAAGVMLAQTAPPAQSGTGSTSSGTAKKHSKKNKKSSKGSGTASSTGAAAKPAK